MPTIKQRWQSLIGPLSHRDRLATLWGTAGLFLILFAYYLVRPIREVHGATIGPEKINRLFAATFVTSLAITPLWGWLVERTSKRRLPVFAFTLIAGSLLSFAGLFATQQSVRLSATFYVWVSVFNYMMVSLFWSLMADTFTNATGRRTFGIITAGGTIGALLGPLAATSLAGHLTESGQLIAAACCFLLVPAVLWMIPTRTEQLDVLKKGSDPLEQASIAGECRLPERVRPLFHDALTEASANLVNPVNEDNSLWAGLRETLGSRYLLGIAAYMMLGSVLGSLLYVHQAAAVKEQLSNPADQQRFFAQADLATNVLSLVFELVIAAPLLTWGGLRWPLLLLPMLGLIAAPALTMNSSVFAVGAILASRRAIEYGLAKPARELLFTVVSRSQKFKAKNFIDSVVARGGDTIGSSISSLVGIQAKQRDLPPTTALWIGLPVAVVFGGVGIWLAKRQQRMAETNTVG